MTGAEIEDRIRAFLLENFIFDPSVHLDADDSFMENGVVDSTGVLEVISWVEATYGFSVADREVLPENFDSINSLRKYVQRKQGSREQAAVL